MSGFAPETPQGWAVVFALAAVGMAAGHLPDAAFDRALVWVEEHQHRLPTEEDAREAFKRMTQP